MARRDGVRGTLVLVVVLLLVAGGVAVVRYDLVDRLRGDDDPSAAPTSEPAEVAPPPGVEVPEVVAPPAVALVSQSTPTVDPTAVRRALQRYLRDRTLGSHVLAEVAPLDGDAAAYTLGGRSDATAVPASTTKVVTSTAALLALGPDHVFTTEVRRRGSRLTLVGGGDPFLERGPTRDGELWPYPARADLQDLAEQTAASLAADGTRRVSLAYDDTLFDGPQVNSRWESGYVASGEVSPTSALWVDRGRVREGLGRVADPSAEAARSFVEALTAAGITVVGRPVAARAASGAVPVAAVDSAPLAQIVQRLLDVSDNDAAEVLLRQVGVATSGEGSIQAGRAGVRRLLRDAGVALGDSVLHDGSGLSRDNRLDPSVLVEVLRLAASDDHPGLRAVVTGLPVAGFTGSLTDRMDQGPAAGRGRVRAKTGTLSNVSALAGLATDVDGNVMVFVLMADRVPAASSLLARVTLDDAAAALGACACTG
ncbi:D-alanyl-D-alanine carboxypeptidase/D-alanyl-D-alanine-endopeptidase [Nocardioides plantarum]|uniref:D-alanyl-D-alanine carboxypeptidase/D-alanyl-D-alanine-endopeptidase n=1 Tax=Nocardioides plantarum TaxID=29299 RepID=A0ABV5KB90_9ACTN|nr:D-alanyl-D-alanine carboxypeptidase/D-alanyl-D-alanine-endopeptidase [Nocardioides plantarum]